MLRIISRGDLYLIGTLPYFQLLSPTLNGKIYVQDKDLRRATPQQCE